MTSLSHVLPLDQIVYLPLPVSPVALEARSSHQLPVLSIPVGRGARPFGVVYGKSSLLAGIYCFLRVAGRGRPLFPTFFHSERPSRQQQPVLKDYISYFKVHILELLLKNVPSICRNG